MINKTSSGNTGKSSGTPTSSWKTTWLLGNTDRSNGNTGKESAIFVQRPTADKMSRDRSHLLYSGSRAFPSSPFDPLKKRGDGGYPPSFETLPKGALRPLLYVHISPHPIDAAPRHGSCCSSRQSPCSPWPSSGSLSCYTPKSPSMAPKAFNREYLEEYLDVLWKIFLFYALIPHKSEKKIPLCRKCFAIRIFGEKNSSDVVQIRSFNG